MTKLLTVAGSVVFWSGFYTQSDNALLGGGALILAAIAIAAVQSAMEALSS